MDSQDNDKYGYARCSTLAQDAEYELKVLMEKGVPRENIYIEYVSGGKTRDQRVEYDKLMKVLEQNPGSELYATDLTRIARNNKDVYELVEFIQKNHLKLDIGSFVVSCKDKEIDPISEVIIMVLGIFATFDLKLKHQQIFNGLAQAKATGKRLGAPNKTKDKIDDQFYKYYAQYKNKQINLTELSKLSGRSRQTCYNLIKLIEDN